MANPTVTSAPRNWPTLLMFLLTGLAAVTLVPWYGIVHGYGVAAWIWFGVFLAANELSITCGYHRLFSHATYRAHPVLRAIYIVFGAMALQNSVLVWSAGHRAHHRFIDDVDQDPYSARRGLWFSHMGWMIRDYPSGIPDFSYVRDLERDPLVAWQHRHYLPLAIGLNVGLPALVGVFTGDIIGTMLLAGLLRLVLSHHLTFLINSAAHAFGSQPYTTDNSARDNPLIAVLTFGEGYHNYHHQFPHDYRNGVRWWQWDPSKWLIWTTNKLGLAHDLKSVPWFRIHRAQLEAQFARAQQDLSTRTEVTQYAQLRTRLAEEYATFQDAISRWSALRVQLQDHAVNNVSNRWERSIVRSRCRELELMLKLQQRRMSVLRAELSST